MNKTLLRKFISWFWGLVYLLPIAFIILAIFRNGFDFSSSSSNNIVTFLSTFEFPLFSSLIDDLINLFDVTDNMGTYCLLYLGSWFLFVTIIKFFVFILYYFICILEDIIFKFNERVTK